MKISNRILDSLTPGELDNLERGERCRFMKSVMDRMKIDPGHAGDLWRGLREDLALEPVALEDEAMKGKT